MKEDDDGFSFSGKEPRRVIITNQKEVIAENIKMNQGEASKKDKNSK